MKKRQVTSAASVKHKKLILATVVTLAAVIAPFSQGVLVRADDYDEKIAAVQRQIDAYNAEAGRLNAEKQTYQGQLAVLSNQKAQIQSQLDMTVAKLQKLEFDISEKNKQIANNQEALGDTMADIYVDEGVTPLEMLASSNNIADYVDKQTNQTQVQTTLESTVKKIRTLRVELEKQKKDVERVKADQENVRDALAAKEAEQAKLIADVAGREDQYTQLSSQAQAQKGQLEQQQQAAIQAAMRRGGGGGGAVAGNPSRGGYPNNLANAPLDSLVDPWGMYNRECVSYTAWKVYQKNGYMPYWGGRGNANQWPGNARAAGIQTSSTPRAQSVGVISSGYYGHVVWVESINGNGTINISQYNEWLPGSGWGQYSERYNVSPSAYDTYIYF
jgi:surface antigen